MRIISCLMENTFKTQNLIFERKQFKILYTNTKTSNTNFLISNLMYITNTIASYSKPATYSVGSNRKV